MGGRSRAAVELLQGRGFKEVYNLKGGLRAWQGLTAWGPESSGMSLLEGGEDRQGLLRVALTLERGLADFYQEMARQAEGEEAIRLLRHLARVEAVHQDKVRAMLGGAAPAGEQGSLPLVEGAIPARELVERLRARGMGLAAILDLALMIETQGMDLYLRLARRAGPGEGRQEMLELAQDEKGHLQALAELREKLLPTSPKLSRNRKKPASEFIIFGT